jgi:hypothetical protein
LTSLRRSVVFAQEAAVAALFLAPPGVPAIAQNLLPSQSPAAPAEPQTRIVLTLATAVIAAVVISVSFFLLGLLCGSAWRRRRRRRYWS